MPPLRAESSTVSLPPRERIVAKRRTKAIQHGKPMPHLQTARVPAPTLAATRTRRLAAMDVAYLSRPDGFHIKRVVRRPATPDRAPSIPYLEGQDDIPRSNKDSDGESDGGTIATLPETVIPAGTLGASTGMNTGVGEVLTQLEDMDYDVEGEDDAEGEDEDAVMNDLPADLASHQFSTSWDNLIPQPQMWPEVLTQTNDLIGDVSGDDLRALFNGLDNFGTNAPDFPSDFPNNSPANNTITGNLALNADIQGAGSFTMHQLHDSQVSDLPCLHSHNGLPSLSVTTRTIPSPTPVDLSVANLTILSPTPAEIQTQTQSPPSAISQPLLIPSVDLPARLLLRRPPLRRSLNLPDFLEDGNSEDSSSSSDNNQLRPATPVAFEDTDIGLNDSSPVPVTQARSRAVRYFNVHVLPHCVSSAPPHIPTVLELRANALKVYKLSLEYRVTRDVLWVNPWPELEGQAAYLSDAQHYATQLTGVSGDDVFTQKFLDTVFYRMSANRGNSLAKIEYLMEHEFGVGAGDKKLLYQLMDNDLFLFPTVERQPQEYFCVGALGSALEIILFKSSKSIGLVFMEDLCKPDNTEKCAHWHRKLRDQTACKGVPPGLLAFAATQMYWALQKLYLGSTVAFDEQHFRGVWNRYFRALIKLLNLGRLRINMLDRLKEYYMAHWPAEEPDEDDEYLPAW
ncbi:hypothetical protein CTheo_6914 [Ceratobasidium theobromae]|uniref:DUF6532 domain-containing protein n=1 Tax=Ceratobasidium theobromae TaxID=1582974 RepID=A0A5N5QDW0_9AGAM|nr:hypothetical protein CTheo_6914 [Ceratobasidium theobromae]